MLKVRYKVDVFLRSGHTVRVEASEYEFERENSGQYCRYKFTNLLTSVSFSVPDIIGYKVVGRSYRLKKGLTMKIGKYTIVFRKWKTSIPWNFRRRSGYISDYIVIDYKRYSLEIFW